MAQKNDPEQHECAIDFETHTDRQQVKSNTMLKQKRSYAQKREKKERKKKRKKEREQK